MRSRDGGGVAAPRVLSEIGEPDVWEGQREKAMLVLASHAVSVDEARTWLNMMGFEQKEVEACCESLKRTGAQTDCAVGED